jgi:carbon storage regulator
MPVNPRRLGNVLQTMGALVQRYRTRQRQIHREEGDLMLVLNRKRGETVMIGENVEVTVLQVHGDRVKLGFRSPIDVAIHREEIYQKINRASQAQAASR